MPLNSNKLFIKYLNDVFVETGTFRGVGLEYALSAGFKHLCSVEIVEQNYKNCCNKFNEEIKSGRIKLFLGASEDRLWDIIKDIKTPITFWLDAHYSGKTKTYTTGKSDIKSPILREIDIVSQHSIKNHTILIDDRRDFGTHNFDGVSEKQIINHIKNINNGYNIVYETGSDKRDLFKNDVLVAYI